MTGFGYLWRLALIYLGLAAAVPTSVRSLASHPDPTHDYPSAVQRVEALKRADTEAARGGESIVLLHGARTPRAIVMFHGFTNSPRQYRQLAATLYESGDNVYVPRLPQHALKGANVDDLSHLTAEQLREIGDASVDAAAGLGDTVIVFGVSLGGSVAAWITQFRSDVDRAVIVAPALGLSHLSLYAAIPVMNLSLRVPDFSKHDPPDTLRVDRALGWSTHAIGQLLRLGKAVRDASGERAPGVRNIVMLVNAHDGTVNRDAIDEQAARWSAHGARVTTFEMVDTLNLPHDMVDPDDPASRTAVTYPVLMALLHGTDPPPALARRVERP